MFTEAASLGKPVIVPRGTWMADKIAEGYGVGMSFEGQPQEALADVILKGLRDFAPTRVRCASNCPAPRGGNRLPAFHRNHGVACQDHSRYGAGLPDWR